MMDAHIVPGPGVVEEARKRLEGVVSCTPVLTCPALSEQAGCELFLKCENLQHAGAFKFRGASHAVAVLSDKDSLSCGGPPRHHQEKSSCHGASGGSFALV